MLNIKKKCVHGNGCPTPLTEKPFTQTSFILDEVKRLIYISIQLRIKSVTKIWLLTRLKSTWLLTRLKSTSICFYRFHTVRT